MYVGQSDFVQIFENGEEGLGLEFLTSDGQFDVNFLR